jgi:hypothetical protein
MQKRGRKHHSFIHFSYSFIHSFTHSLLIQSIIQSIDHPFTHSSLVFRNLFSKIGNLLKFPHSPKVQRLPTPSHVSARATKMEKISEEKQSAAEKAAAKKKDRCFPILMVN